MAFLAKKYKSFTLVETIVALVITMICVGIAFTIMLNVERSGNNFRKIQAHLCLLQELNKVKKEKKFLDENIDLDNMRIEKTFTQYEGIDKLYEMKLTVFDNDGKKLDALKQLVIIDE
jgi:hypothetical protein